MKIGAKAVEANGGMMADGPLGAIRHVLTTPTLLIGLVCFGLNVFLYMFALQSPTLKISIAYPLMVGGGFAIIAVVAYLAPNLRERLTAGQWLGVLMILAGVFIVASKTASSPPPA
jgi:multidrug transporter EmrE-like cation transporter